VDNEFLDLITSKVWRERLAKILLEGERLKGEGLNRHWLEHRFGTIDAALKVIPDNNTLELAYHRARDAERLNEALDEIQDEHDTAPVPKGLRKQVLDMLGEGYPRMSWDTAISTLVHREMKVQKEKIKKRTHKSH
jgi:hypothetical protein